MQESVRETSGAVARRLVVMRHAKAEHSASTDHVRALAERGLGDAEAAGRWMRDHGIKLVHMRHEQSCAYAADAYARTSRRPGVLAVTAGCGLTNAVTGLCVAHLAGSAVVCLAGQHPTAEDGVGSFQEAYGADICASFTKSAKRVLDWTTIGRDVRAAFRAAQAWPVGPTLVEIPTNVLYQQGAPARQRPGAQVFDPDRMRGLADPAAVEIALDRLAAAERPLIVAGDGVFWSDAAAEEASRRGGGGALWTPGSEAMFRRVVIQTVREDPLWYGEILLKRVAATTLQWKLWPWRPRDGTPLRQSTSWNEGFMDKYYGYSTTVDHAGLGPWRAELPISALLVPGAILLGLRRAAPLLVMGAVAVATLGLPVLMSTAAAQETQAFALVHFLGLGFLLDELWRRRGAA